MPSRHWLYFGGFLISAVLTAGALLFSVVDAFSVLAGGAVYGEEFVLIAMISEAAEWIMAALVVGTVSLVFLLATGVSILKNASLPRDDRLVTVVEWLERQYPVLRQFDVSNKVEPTTEDRRKQLKEQYVNGELSDTEFERRLEQLMDGESPPERSRSGDTTTIEIEDDQ